MLRRAAQLAALTTTFAACNALTGVGDLAEDPFTEAGSDAPAPVPTTTATGTTTTEPPPPPPPDDGGSDAVADVVADTGADTGPADTGADTQAPVCTPTATPVRYPLQTASDEVGSPSWSERNGARAPNDDTRAHTNGDNPNTLSLRVYGFGLPANARILGLVVEIHRTTDGPTSDSAVTLSKGTAKNNGPWPEGPHDGPYIKTTYGSATDLWGTTWSADDLNSASFSVNLKTTGDGDGHVDAVGVIVHYCLPQ
ncbi:MAG: hypothetical protein KIT84_24560 [Labilithrix sp.]|nr:hypothetical protein [Labilithrix sp.]MCW5814222.1 hypothetical protein [Labilithrix sp.]